MQGIQRIEIVEVIKTKTVVGKGTEEDPVREVVQYWEKNGQLITNEAVCSIKEQRNKLEKILMDFIEKASEEPPEAYMLPQTATILADLIKTN